MADQEQLVVGPEDEGLRLDVYLALRVERLSRSQAKKLLDEHAVTVDGEPAKPRTRLKPGQQVTFTWHEPPPLSALPEDIPLHIVYEDADLLVVDKPAPLVVHPAKGSPHGTMVNALLAHGSGLSEEGGPLRPGIVHRLDRDTTGLLVVAKHDVAHRRLAAQLQSRVMHREYLAIVYGEPEWFETTVDQPIARHPTRRQEMAVVEGGRVARTHLVCLERYGRAALLAARLDTGRTHQVRIHCTHLGHPLYGDRTYGHRRAQAFWPLPAPVAAALAALPGQALHAARLEFQHPLDGRPLSFTAEPHAEFAALLAALRATRAAEPLPVR